jgi:hypothetical protein
VRIHPFSVSFAVAAALAAAILSACNEYACTLKGGGDPVVVQLEPHSSSTGPLGLCVDGVCPIVNGGEASGPWVLSTPTAVAWYGALDNRYAGVELRDAAGRVLATATARPHLDYPNGKDCPPERRLVALSWNGASARLEPD